MYSMSGNSYAGSDGWNAFSISTLTAQPYFAYRYIYNILLLYPSDTPSNIPL